MEEFNESRVSTGLSSLQQLKKLEKQSLDGFHLADSVEIVCEKLACVLLQSNKRCKKVDETLCTKEFAATVWKILIEAARQNLDPDLLCQGFGDSAIARGILSAYKEHAAALRDVLPTIGWEHPKVVGIDWSVLSVVESNADVEIEEPLAEITFKTLPTGQTTSNTFKFLCNKNQLQDLQWKVKEAYNMLQKTSRK